MSHSHNPALVSTSAGHEAASREKRWVALTSVAAAVLLTAMKLIVGLLTGSLGLLAEAAHSGLDLVAAIITYFAVRFSDKPADAEHLYGHGKVENLSALVETLLLLITCGWIIYEAVERLFFKAVAVDATVTAFGVVIISIVIDISRSRALMRAARKHGSQALEADALHFSTDVWSSGVVLLGLAFVRFSEGTRYHDILHRADAAAALIVALIVIWVSYQLGKRTIDMLLDRAPAGLAPAVEKAVRQIEGILQCRRLRLRQAGNQTFVDLVIAVQRGLSVETSHNLSLAAEERIKALLPNADVVVHVDPVSGGNETLPERIRAIAVNLGQHVHNVSISDEGGRVHVELHVETDENMDLRVAHSGVDALEKAIAAELPEITRITTHIEPRRAREGPLRDVTASSQELIEQVRRIAAAAPGIEECHDILVGRAGAELVLTMHCTFAAGLSVREAHDSVTGVEERLRAEIPRLARITIHSEPRGT